MFSSILSLILLGFLTSSILAYDIDQTTDFSDAPLTYDDASAEIEVGFNLGRDVDGEAGAHPSAGATGDDETGRDDEDGLYVIGGGIDNRLGQVGDRYLISIVASVPREGYVSCWIDFDGSGSFEASEKIVNSWAVTYANGGMTVNKTVPEGAVAGLTYLRCRLTDIVGDALPTGGMGFGEVEDYHVTIDPPDPPRMSLGSAVFLDLDNDGVYEPAQAEFGLPDVTVELYAAGADEVMGGGDDVLLGTQLTNDNGLYFFDELLPGKYYLRLPTPPLRAPLSSKLTDTKDNQIDGDDNGIQPGGVSAPIHSPIILLAEGEEPTGLDESSDGGHLDDAYDANGDMTVDFGLVDLELRIPTNTPTPTFTPTASPTFTPTSTMTPTPTPTATATAVPLCVIYGVHDEAVADSQIILIDVQAQTISPLGSLYPGENLEGLAIYNGELFTISTYTGDFYRVDRSSGNLTYVGSTGLSNMKSLAFKLQDGSLWSWAFGTGLVTIDPANAEVTVVFPSTDDMEALAWGNDGTVLYGALGNKLFAIDVIAETVTQIADNLPGNTEGLEMRPDGLLMGGVHEIDSLSLFSYDIVTKQVVFSESIVSEFSDIEGIAWPVECGVPNEQFN